MTLPFKLTLSFNGWEGNEVGFLSIFNKIAFIKLFTLELEFDRKSFFVFIKNQSTLTLNAFQKVLILSDIMTINEAKKLTSFAVVYDIPFYLSLDETRDILTEIKKGGNNDITLSYFLTSNNFDQFKEVLDFAISFGIKKIIIPNPDIVNKAFIVKESFLKHSDLKRLEFLKNYTDKLNFQVHDYFLAKYMGLKDAELFNGCQGGAVMGYINNGTVYPCKSIPLSLGSLFEEDFVTIWKRTEVIMGKYSLARQCEQCEDKQLCKLGCPGTAFFLNNGEKDPLCEK